MSAWDPEQLDPWPWWVWVMIFVAIPVYATYELLVSIGDEIWAFGERREWWD